MFRYHNNISKPFPMSREQYLIYWKYCQHGCVDHSRVWLEGSIFNSYYTEVYVRALLDSLD